MPAHDAFDEVIETLNYGFEKILRWPWNDGHIFCGSACEPDNEGRYDGTNEYGIRQPLNEWFPLR
jgi:hypothetical protein